ncbi:uncharacterized protein LOC143138681 [Alosa pseudoharengus]|uniref:uncharacterized protein LOC143138681 n=1 Tax=Alosa pseudoharengus TaxID=34774 RepID=UPI003F8B949B
MDSVRVLLEKHRLLQHYGALASLGVEDERDLLDSVTDQDLTNMSLTQVERNRFRNMQVFIRKLGPEDVPFPHKMEEAKPADAYKMEEAKPADAYKMEEAKPADAYKMDEAKPADAYCLLYTFPKCAGKREVTGLDPGQNSVEDVLFRIGQKEGIGHNMAVCLFTDEGMPLSDDPFFNTWSLSERHIENRSELYAIFTPKENVRSPPQNPALREEGDVGDHTVRCHVMLRGFYEIQVDLACDTLVKLKARLSSESGIPSHVLHLRDLSWNSAAPLGELGITEESVVLFSLSSFDEAPPDHKVMFSSDVTPSVQQTQMGLSFFYSTLQCIQRKHTVEMMKKVLCYMRRVTGCPPLVQCLHQVLSRNEAATRIQKIAAVEGLYRLFRELLPSRSRMSGDLAVEDHEVFEHSHVCWAHLLAEAESEPPENRKSTAVQSEAPENRKSTAVQNEAPGDGDSILVQSNAPENRKSTAVQSEAPENRKSTAVQNEAPGDGDSISVQSDAPENRKSTAVQSEAPENRKSTAVQSEAPENRKSTAVQSEAPENRKSTTVQSDDSDDWDSISDQSEDSDDGDCTSEQSEDSDDGESTSEQSEDSDDGESTWVRLYCEQTRLRFFEPVRIAYLLQVFEKSQLLQKLKDGESIPGCPPGLLREVCVRRATDVYGESIPGCPPGLLREVCVRRATDVEKLLLSLPPWMKRYPASSTQPTRSGMNFCVAVQKSFVELEEGLNRYPHLQVTPPLRLKEVGVEAPRLVFLGKDNLGVYTGRNKGSKEAILFDCLNGKTVYEDLDQLSNRLGDVRTDQALSISRTPHEAILVLLDSSTSMRHECYFADAAMDRMTAVKQLFDAFANRSMAYNFHIVIGLVTFGRSVDIIHTFTENLEKFKQRMQSLEAKGNTPLYDALDLAAAELGKMKEQFPECRLRALCLTDGYDTSSSQSPVEVTNKLLSSGIVVDSILVRGRDETLVGNENILEISRDDRVLHGITNATGGSCFKPATSTEALKLFEMETVLSLESRRLKRKPVDTIKSLGDLSGGFSRRGYDEQPDVKLPEEIKSKVTVTEKAVRKRMVESKRRWLMEKDKRILEELKSLHCDPHPYCSLFPSEKDLTFWRLLMRGPPDTPYEDGVFELYCQFGSDYPIKPPLVRFITPVYHCNVNSVGRICHSIFDRNYSAHITMREILDAIYGLLIAPEPDDPLDSVLAEEFMTAPEKYKAAARRHTKVVASGTMEEMEKKLVGVELGYALVPPHLLCPLTKKLFVDPVKTEYGTVYERQAIERHLKEVQTDPLSGRPLSGADIKGDRVMRRCVMEYRSRQIQETSK